MAASFNQQFDQHGAWRREFTLRLKLLGDWMKDHELLDAALQERLHRGHDLHRPRRALR